MMKRLSKRIRAETRATLQPRLPAPPLSEAQLAALYADLNKTRFAGRLPPAILEWRQPPAGMAASTHAKSALGPSIWIHPLYAAGKAWVRRTLLHEMCHVEVGIDGRDFEPEHGPRWRAAMCRLRDQGERWVAKDLAKASAAEAEKDSLLTPILKAMEKLDRELPFSQILELLLGRFGRKRGPRFMRQVADLIQSDVRIVEYWHHLGGRFT